MSQRPILIVNPRDDVTFRALVDDEIAAGAETVADLQSVLRQRYPRAAVHLREISDESPVVWYVYREGRWIPPGDAAGG